MMQFVGIAVVVALAILAIARIVMAGGAASLNLADRVLGRSSAERVAEGLAYAPGARHRLDIWRPAGASDQSRLPVVVFVYGGGWHSGARGDYGFAGRALAERGFLVVIPDYRLTPEAHWPDFLEDSAAATAWTLRNIAAHGGDPARVALAGHSAGAYNATMLALDPQWLNGAGADAGQIRGVAALAGPFDFLPLEPGGSADKAMGQVQPIERTQPVRFARGDAPPLWLATGLRDTVVRPRNSRNLAKAVTAAGGRAALREYPGMDHYDIVMALAHPFRGKGPVLDDMADFLNAATAAPAAAKP